MDITTALKETGKGQINIISSEYSMLDDNRVLYWYDRKTNEKTMPVNLDCINLTSWSTYHPVEQIRPEKAGEVWLYDGNNCTYYVKEKSIQGDEGLNFIMRNNLQKEIGSYVIHGENDWTRLFPPVEEDVERIEIEGVKWADIDDGDLIGIEFYAEPYQELRDMKLSKKPPMKMILEWRKP